jgi:hypothetical protein
VFIDIEKNNRLVFRLEAFWYFLALLFFGPGFSNKTRAQTADSTANAIVNHQVWIDFYPHYYMNKKLEYYGDTGYRTIVSKRSWSRLYVRPSVKYHLNKIWEFHSGVGIFYIFNIQDIDQFEITPWQGVQLNWPQWKSFGFKNLVRLEERMSFLTSNWIMDFEFRMRYKVTGKYDFHQRWYVSVYGEYFLPVTGEIKEIFTNKGRAGIELGHKPTKTWQVSFVYNWQGSRTGAKGKLNTSDYTYQLKIKKVWSRQIHKKHSTNK